MYIVRRNPINEVQNLFTSVFNGNGLRTNIGIDNLHNYITFEEGLIKIYCKSTVNSDNVLKFNKNSDQKRFRYYKGDGQKPITLYKLTEFVE